MKEFLTICVAPIIYWFFADDFIGAYFFPVIVLSILKRRNAAFC
jgi:hypothetical protein